MSNMKKLWIPWIDMIRMHGEMTEVRDATWRRVSETYFPRGYSCQDWSFRVPAIAQEFIPIAIGDPGPLMNHR